MDSIPDTPKSERGPSGIDDGKLPSTSSPKKKGGLWNSFLCFPARMMTGLIRWFFSFLTGLIVSSYWTFRRWWALCVHGRPTGPVTRRKSSTRSRPGSLTIPGLEEVKPNGQKGSNHAQPASVAVAGITTEGTATTTTTLPSNTTNTRTSATNSSTGKRVADSPVPIGLADPSGVKPVLRQRKSSIGVDGEKGGPSNAGPRRVRSGSSGSRKKPLSPTSMEEAANMPPLSAASMSTIKSIGGGSSGSSSSADPHAWVPPKLAAARAAKAAAAKAEEEAAAAKAAEEAAAAAASSSTAIGAASIDAEVASGKLADGRVIKHKPRATRSYTTPPDCGIVKWEVTRARFTADPPGYDAANSRNRSTNKESDIDAVVDHVFGIGFLKEPVKLSALVEGLVDGWEADGLFD